MEWQMRKIASTILLLLEEGEHFAALLCKVVSCYYYMANWQWFLIATDSFESGK